MGRRYVSLVLLFSVALFALGAGFGFYVSSKEKKQSVAQIEEAFESRLALLEERLAITEEQAAGAAEAGQALKETILSERSQDELLTDAVSKTAPSVVSIIIAKDVAKLETIFVNPFGDDPRFRNFNIRVPQVVERGTERRQIGAGSGFFIRSNGYIATNRHVVEDPNAIYVAVLSNGSQLTASVVYRDPEIDFALLKIAGTGYRPVTFGNSDELRLGQSVFAIGNALGEFSNSVSVGIVSGLNRDIEAVTRAGTTRLSHVIQTDAAINPGNSGGPLVNLSGEVVGINVATARNGENVSFSIPINVISSTIRKILP